MRSYAFVESRLFSQIKNLSQYSYGVYKTLVQPYEDWPVASIKFEDHTKDVKGPATLLTVCIYHFRDGFKSFKLLVSTDTIKKEIILQFVQIQNAQKPQIEDNAGDLYMLNIITNLENDFNKKSYLKNIRDIYRLIERISWTPEMEIVAVQKKKYGYCQSVSWTQKVALGVVGIISVSSLIYYLQKKK